MSPPEIASAEDANYTTPATQPQYRRHNRRERLGAGEEITRAAVLTFITKQATKFFIVKNA